MEFLYRGIIPIQIQELNLFVLMYADDMVIFSEKSWKTIFHLHIKKLHLKWKIGLQTWMEDKRNLQQQFVNAGSNGPQKSTSSSTK